MGDMTHPSKYEVGQKYRIGTLVWEVLSRQKAPGEKYTVSLGTGPGSLVRAFSPKELDAMGAVYIEPPVEFHVGDVVREGLLYWTRISGSPENGYWRSLAGVSKMVQEDDAYIRDALARQFHPAERITVTVIR